MSFNDMHVDVNTYGLNYLNMKPIVRLFDNIIIYSFIVLTKRCGIFPN